MRQLDAEMRGLWESLSPNERRVLLGVSAGLSPTQSETVALTGLRSRSSAQRATEVLTGKGVLEREGDEALRIVDPLPLTLLQQLGLVVLPGPRLLPRVLAHQLKKLRRKR